MDNGSDLPQGSGWGDASGRGPEGSPVLREETQPQEEGGHRERRTGSPEVWSSGAPLCPSPCCPAHRGRLKSIQSRAEGTVTPGSALGPGSRHPRWVPGIPPVHVVLGGGTTLSSQGEGPRGPPSHPRAKETTPDSGPAPSSLHSVSPLLGQGHQHPGRETVRQVPRRYLLNVTPR